MAVDVQRISFVSCFLLGLFFVPLVCGSDACGTPAHRLLSPSRNDQPNLEISTGFEQNVDSGEKESIGRRWPRFVGSVCLQLEVCEEYGNVDVGERLNAGVLKKRHDPHGLPRRRHLGAQPSFLRVIDGARRRAEAHSDSSTVVELLDRWISTFRGTTRLRPARCRAVMFRMRFRMRFRTWFRMSFRVTFDPGTGSQSLGLSEGARSRNVGAPSLCASTPFGPLGGTGIGLPFDPFEGRRAPEGPVTLSGVMSVPRVPLSRSLGSDRFADVTAACMT